MEPAIQARGLTKTFDKRPERGLFKWRPLRPKERITALDGVDLDIPQGELFGLLGPNAAGKTTLVKLLATLLLPTSGSASVAGHDLEREGDAVRRKVGVVLGGDRALYWRLTARENLWYFSQLYNMPSELARRRIDAQLEQVGLTERADERVETYSKGMKQRLHIARGLLHEPDILLLDEPSIGLDPHAARTLRALVRDLAGPGKRTVLLTTHYMFEADELSDRVAILHQGRIIACAPPASLKARYADRAAFKVTVQGNGAPPLRGALGSVPGVARIVSEQADAARGTITYRLFAEDAARDELAGDLARAVAEARGHLVALAREEPTLEDVFVELTGKELAAKEGAPPG